MNLRIQQLAEQAAEQAVFDDLDPCMITEADSGQLLKVPAAFVQRFAELIVRECANVAAEQSAFKPEYRIRKHFGVEE